jgi:hypothetical protein
MFIVQKISIGADGGSPSHVYARRDSNQPPIDISNKFLIKMDEANQQNQNDRCILPFWGKYQKVLLLNNKDYHLDISNIHIYPSIQFISFIYAKCDP